MERAGDIVERFGIEGFLEQADLPSNLSNSLAHLAEWARGTYRDHTLSQCDEQARRIGLLPEDLLEAHLSLAVRHAEDGKAREAGQALRSAEEICQEKPLFESQLRLLQVRVRIAGEAEPQDARQARRLLARCHGGIHGTTVGVPDGARVRWPEEDAMVEGCASPSSGFGSQQSRLGLGCHL